MADEAEPTDYRPYSGSCPRCRAALGLASVRGDDGRWYCSTACAAGGRESPQHPAVDEDSLQNRPRRFFRQRRPKELRGSRP